jgi:hypothetical protein
MDNRVTRYICRETLGCSLIRESAYRDALIWRKALARSRNVATAAACSFFCAARIGLSSLSLALSLWLNSNKGTKCDIEIRAARTFAGGSRL